MSEFCDATPRALIEDGDVRLDSLVMDKPGQHLGGAVISVGGAPLGPGAEALAPDHGPGCADLGLGANSGLQL